uniref:Uncharacterized protein n=1 Tax=Desertifilum tharense IPPAS B-1220 TaxID=1781255 RepID=A0ACD5H083_9CYAN
MGKKGEEDLVTINSALFPPLSTQHFTLSTHFPHPLPHSALSTQHSELTQHSALYTQH